MKLDRVLIKNYRSIPSLKITFEPKCRILVGINESGKTNILTALNLLDPKNITTLRDLREAATDEDEITEAYVRFMFSFTPEEGAQIANEVKRDLLAKDFDTPIIKVEDKEFTLEGFCRWREGMYDVDILTHEKTFNVYTLKNAKILNNWKKVSADCPETLVASAEN